ncbi:hypothetical protein HanXRQr2_Chr07g0308371 [Helianthus annuus]|uniref:Late embryogenesis abundant protein, LEA-14 n=1 Tax=Helianthus annuus TaxID=4232 RepID=A0A9K3IMV9_HELAN|nr:hypothetical protein HanXRQr2_Chr07g0308371 [Helianthus annuus]
MSFLVNPHHPPLPPPHLHYRCLHPLHPLPPPPPHILHRRPQNLPIQPLHHIPRRHHPPHFQTQPHPFHFKSQQKKLHFYDPFIITLQSHETQLANGSFPNSLTIKPNNITIIHSQLYTTSLLLDPESVTKIRSDLKKKSRLSLKLLLDTEFRVKIETLRTKKVGIRIKCDGIHSLIPKGGGTGWNTTVAATVTAAKWTF